LNGTAEGFRLWTASLPRQALAGNPADPCNNVAIAAAALNRMLEFGRPNYVRIS